MSVDETRKGVKFDQPLTAAQKRRYGQPDGKLVIRAEGQRGDTVEAHVDRVKG